MENTKIYDGVRTLCLAAKESAKGLSATAGGLRDAVLFAFAKLLNERQNEILKANETDLQNARENGVMDTMLDRLRLTSARIEGMAEGVLAIARLTDPIGEGECWTRPNGLLIRRVRVPMGVVGVIFEARPNVAADVAALCIKSGNAAVLRGGREALASNRAVVALAKEALVSVLGESFANAVSLIEETDRASAVALMQMRGLVDVLIPRGGKGLIRSVVDNARVPVIETGAGNCHLYVHEDGDLSIALAVLVNAKISRPSVCNACETLLVHKGVAAEFLPRVKAAMDRYHCEIRGCARTLAILPDVTPADEEDWDTEYNDLILAVKVVDSLTEAIDHINAHGTGHSETIVTKSIESKDTFQHLVDAAAVYANASSRFTDGGEFGFGAEVGISTQKLHARGPMGMKALTTEKYLIDGNGQIR